jgi:hypothetical protein
MEGILWVAVTGTFADAVRFSDALRAKAAVSVSLVAIELISRLLNVAEPDERFVEVVPPNTPALSVIEIELLAPAATEPLSVNCTTGAGESGCPMIALEGGWIVKASA